MPTNKGFTIVEALIALLLLTITLVGSLAFYFYSDESMALATHRRMATELANSELEKLKNTPYANILSSGAVDVSIGGLITGKKEIAVEAGPEPADNKKVTIKIVWNEASAKNPAIRQNLELITYIAKP